MEDTRAPRRRAQARYWGLIALQALALTLGLAGVITRSALALRDYVSPNFGDGWLSLFALVAGVLLGLTVISGRALVPIILAMSLGAAIIFALVIYLPAWQGTLFRSTTFANYAQQQALFHFLWVSIPASIGGLIGHLAGEEIRRAIDIRHYGAAPEHTPWWERARRERREDAQPPNQREA